jgi:outer membrane receptor protein involved in Fe transport
VLLIWLLFIHCFVTNIWAQTPLELPPLQVQHSSTANEPRSIEWPVESRPSPSTLLLPQIDESLNTLNGLQARSQGSPTFSLRGSGQSGRALVLYNDIPLNFASGFGPPLIFLPKETVGQITVVKGPASLFYGSQAMSGSINFQSTKLQQAQVVATLSDHDESFLPWRKGSLAHNSLQFATPIWQSARHHYQISVFNETDDGQFSFRTQESSGVRQFNAQNLSRLVMEGESHWHKLYLATHAILGRHIRQSPGPVNQALPTREETEGLLLSATPHYFFDHQWSLKSQLSYMDSQSEFRDDFGPTQTQTSSLIIQNELIYEWSKNSRMQFFVDGFQHRLANTFLGEDQSQDQLELGPFLSFQPQWSPLVYKVGGRYLPQFQRFLGTAAVHHPLQHGELWLSFAEGFRNPSLSDLYSDSPFFVGNPNLNPEISQQWELGWNHIKNWQTLLWQQEVRLYHIQYLDFIETFEINPGLFSRQNQGRGWARGLDWESSLGWGDNRAYAHYNFLDTRNQQNLQPFRLSPRHQFAVGLDKRVAGKVYFETQNVQWLSNHDIINNQVVKLRDWSQWNFFLRWQLQKNMGLRVGLVNAFDEQRELSLNYPEPGRRYWMQWHYAFDPKQLF